MPRFRITVAYDGRPFAGWQSQPDANTVQDTIETAIASIAGISPGACRIHGSGRTDAGVHALGQVAHFDSPHGSNLEPGIWMKALNAKLPETVRITECSEVSHDFHARFSATKKTYVYRIHHATVHPPLEAGRAWHLYGTLDLDTIREGLTAINGRHDFCAFVANRGDESDLRDSRVRSIFETNLTEDNGSISLEITGDGFLYKMVRLLTGGLVRCAQGRTSIDWFLGLLRNPKDQKCQYCAPAHGLYLKSVAYSQRND